MKTVYILLNTGSPRDITIDAVKEYLHDFLSDPRVLTMPAPIRWWLVNHHIVPKRAPYTLSRYRQIWTSLGTPLEIDSHQLAAELQKASGSPVFCGMLYQHQGIETALEKAAACSPSKVILVPLFPHYAMSSFETHVAKVCAVHKKRKYPFPLACVAPYYNNEEFLRIWANNLKAIAQPGEHVIASYHNILQVQAKPYKGDPKRDYEQQCYTMTKMLFEQEEIRELGLSYEVAFQSEMHRSKWLAPTLSEALKRNVQLGRKQLVVISPSFVIDCLETTNEILGEVLELFRSYGGEELRLVPCPGPSEAMAQMLYHHSQNATDEYLVY